MKKKIKATKPIKSTKLAKSAKPTKSTKLAKSAKRTKTKKSKKINEINKTNKPKIIDTKERNINIIKNKIKNFKKCIKNSNIFFITLILCTILLTNFKNKKNNFMKLSISFFSLFISIYLSYHIHIYSHSFNFYKIYNNCLKKFKSL